MFRFSEAAYEDAGPTILAMQPVTLPAYKDQKADPQWGALYAHLQSRMAMLRTWRYTWWAHWARLAEYILPYRYKWLVTANSMYRGSPLNQAIVDETPTLAMRVCASGMLDGLMGRSRPWFKLSGPPGWQADPDALDWLDDAEQKIYQVFAESNFYGAMAQMFQDEATFGTSPVIIYEDFEDIIRCYVPCAGEYYLATGGRLSVDTLYREFTFTVSQIVDFFGLDNCPSEVREAWQEGGGTIEREFVVAHSIEPNFEIRNAKGGSGFRPVPAHFVFRETYWLMGIKTAAPLSLRGFTERPFVVARWSVTANDAYGRGPGMDALPGSAQLQVEQMRKGEFIDKLVRPPMGASPKMKQEPSSIIAGQVTYTSTENGEKGFWPLFEVQPAALGPMVEDVKEVQSRVDRCFFVPVFQAITRMEGVEPRNELELSLRQGEAIQQLGPVIDLHEGEVASPAIRRVAGILLKRGLLKPVPPSLRGVPVQIKHVSTLRLVQKAAATAPIEQTLSFAARLTEGAQAAGVAPPLRIFKLDKVARQYADDLAFPADTMFTEQEMAQQDQAAIQQKQAQDLAAGGMAAVQAAQGLSQVDVGGGRNAVQALLGTGQQGGAGA